MDTDRGLQEVVSRNVRVLMAVHGITHQKDLAGQLSWGADKLARTLNGSRRWALEDLPRIAEVFGVTPAALLSDTAELVGASRPAVGAVTRGVTHEYRSRNDARIIPFPPTQRRRPRYPRRLTRTGDVRHLAQAAPLNGISSASVTHVTSVVGS